MPGMETLILIGLVSGIVTALSPCVLPVLPVVLVASTTPAPTLVGAGAPVPADDPPPRSDRWRPYLVILGLVASFSIFTLAGSALLTLLGLPQDLLRWLGIIVLALAGLGLLVPKFGELIERPFARIPMRKLDRNASAFTVGLGLGLVFVPCAGPVLAAITVLSATGSIDLKLVALTLSFAIGVAIPLLIFALAGQRIGERIRAFRSRAVIVRRVAGAILLAMSIAIAFNLPQVLQRSVPGYVSAIQDRIEGSDAARDALGSLSGATSNASFDQCAKEPEQLQECGPAPDFTGIEQWLNTAGGSLNLAELRGQVVLIDFWTYSCINCQRTIPVIKQWDQAYRDSGLTVVGVHTPEFGFERVPSNVARATKDFGIEYPVAIDNAYGTWTEYGNRYWPARYLIDSTGEVRQVHYGEGKNQATETLIRQLLTQANPTAQLPDAVTGSDYTLTEGRTPETYLGYNRLSGSANDFIAEGTKRTYQSPSALDRNRFAFDGEWTVGPQFSTAGTNSTLRINTYAANSYAVLAGEGNVELSVNGSVTKTFQVSGLPRLYPLTSGDPVESQLQLRLSPGLQIYSLTFG